MTAILSPTIAAGLGFWHNPTVGGQHTCLLLHLPKCETQPGPWRDGGRLPALPNSARDVALGFAISGSGALSC